MPRLIRETSLLFLGGLVGALSTYIILTEMNNIKSSNDIVADTIAPSCKSIENIINHSVPTPLAEDSPPPEHIVYVSSCSENLVSRYSENRIQGSGLELLSASEATLESIALLQKNSSLVQDSGVNSRILNFAKSFNKEDKEAEWGYVMEQQITDFIVASDTNHELYSYTIDCREASCAVRGIQGRPNAWDETLSEMKNEGWWETPHGSSVSIKKPDGTFEFLTIIVQND